MLNLLLATVITIVGVIILLLLTKPSREEIAFDDLEKAWNELLDAFAKSLKIDRFLEWLIRKLNRYQKRS
ncbi:hypothetical protein [Sporosarcina sp. FSL K6-2383]|uniref:hypothetical protein n=1 Tax=Sporosarcina sp. FSL K6-2383 TaxID=2921556 RepID=UPI00315ACD09